MALGYRYLETDLQVDLRRRARHVPRRHARRDHRPQRHDLASSLERREGGQGRRDRAASPASRSARRASRRPLQHRAQDRSAPSVPFIEAVERTGIIDRICCGSFSDSRLRTIRKALGPSSARAWATGPCGRLRFASWLRIKALGRSDAACSQVPTKEKILPVADQPLHRASPTARPRGARLDDRRRRRDEPPARPRRRRDHDRQAVGAEGRAGAAGPMGGLTRWSCPSRRSTS